jgi:uncharacterized protein (TIGR02466 family)
MILENWFHTPIWFIDNSCDLEKIKKGCLKIRNSTQGRVLSNLGGWQSEGINLEDYEEFQELSTELSKHFNDICADIRQQCPNFNLKLGSIWININGPNDYNVRHTHPNAALSGAFYVSVDEHSGEIVFYNPSAIHHYPITAFDLFYRSVKYKPRNGMLIIFPSWIEHEVYSSPNSVNDRISISFNLREV